MKSISSETHYPNDQYDPDNKDENGKPQLKAGAKGYKIKPLNSLQFMEVMTDGHELKGGIHKMNSEGVKLLLRYGLEDPSIITSMPAIHLVDTAQAIYTKSALSEAERKN